MSTDDFTAWPRITDPARRVLQQASERAADRGLHVLDGPIFSALVLWTLLRWERKVGLVAIEHTGANLVDLAQDVDALLSEYQESCAVAIDPDGRLVMQKSGIPAPNVDYGALRKRLLKQAQLEAQELGHDWIGTEHLVLAIARSAEAPLAELLATHSITHERTKSSVQEVLGRG
jgi:ATP-dependent Clp protease ATP-binding subunit ClpA